MKNIVFFLFVFLVGCKKDNGPIGTVEFNPAVCLVDDWGDSATVEVTRVNMAALHIVTSSVPAGWEAYLSADNRLLTVTAPASPSSEVESAGTLSVQGLDTRGQTIAAQLPVAIGVSERLEPASCWVASTPRRVYSFDAMRRGFSETAMPTAEVKLIWMSPSGLLSSVGFENGRGSFYLPPASDGSLVEGNALIGAYAAAGNLLWHWHVWVTSDPASDAVTLASGEVIMNRNLGAEANSAADDDARLASYGLYYQWGRPTPFPAPRNFDASTEYDGLIYDHRNYLITSGLSYVDFDASRATLAYALAHPLHYLLGGDTAHGDWISDVSEGESLWSETQKTLYDPCPTGWKVPAASVFASLRLAATPAAGAPSDALRAAYGWELTDGTATSRFHATGRRSALTGRIQNLNTCAVPQPWSGGYWTASTAGADAAQPGLERTSEAMYFDLNTEDAALSTLNVAAHYPRATGLAVRCVRMKMEN